jgi:two-component system, NarL family, sensor kinase
MEVADPTGYGPQVDELLYRACREGLRNVEDHAGATHVAVRVYRDGGRAILEVRDDGRGIPEPEIGRRKHDGHVGVQIVRDIVHDGGGTLSVQPSPERGTILRAEVPIP